MYYILYFPVPQCKNAFLPAKCSASGKPFLRFLHEMHRGCALPCKNTFLQHNCSILLCKMHPWRYAQSPRGRMDVIFIFECFEIHILQFYKMKTEKKVSFKSYGNQPFCLQNV